MRLISCLYSIMVVFCLTLYHLGSSQTAYFDFTPSSTSPQPQSDFLALATSNQIYNEHGCLQYNPAKFFGFQQPPSLNLPYTVLSVDQCDTTGTYAITSTLINNSEVFKCECKPGFVGKSCELRFLASSFSASTAGSDPTLAGYSSKLAGIIIHNTGARLRFRWGYVDDAKPNQWSFFPTRPFVHDATAISSAYDFLFYALGTSALVTQGMPNYEASLGAMDYSFALQPPPPAELTKNITCVTLMSYVVSDDQIHVITPVDLNKQSYTPLAQFTIVKEPWNGSSSANLGANTAQYCAPPFKLHSFVTPSYNGCYCDQITTTFGDRCQFSFVHSDTAVLVPRYFETNGLLDVILTTVRTEHTITITVPDAATVFSDFVISENFTGFISAPIPISPSQRVGNTYTISYSLSMIERRTDAVGEEQVVFNLAFTDQGSKRHPLPVGLVTQLTNSCQLNTQAGCSKEGTATCRDDQCICNPGWIGTQCFGEVLAFTPDEAQISLLGGTNLYLRLGQTIFVKISNKHPEGIDIGINWDQISLELTNGLGLPPVVGSQELPPNSGMFLGRIQVPSVTTAIILDENSTVNNNSPNNNGSLKISVAENNVEVVQVFFSSSCFYYYNYLGLVSTDHFPNAGVAGCDSFQLYCNEGWFGAFCEFNMGSLERSNSAPSPSTPFYPGELLKWTNPTSAVPADQQWQIGYTFHLFDRYASSSRVPVSIGVDPFEFPLLSGFTEQPQSVFLQLQFGWNVASNLRRTGVTLGPFNLLTCENYRDLLPAQTTYLHSPCVVANTKTCQIKSFIDPASTLRPCECKANYTGPQCQTKVILEERPGLTHDLYFEHTSGYPEPLLFGLGDGDIPLIDLQSNIATSFPIGGTGIGWASRAFLTYPSPALVPFPLNVVPSLSGSLNYVTIRSLRETSPDPCYSGSIQPPSVSSIGSRCNCALSKHFGPRCEFYTDIDQEWEVRLDPAASLQLYYPHSTVTLRTGRTVPQTTSDSLSQTDPTLIAVFKSNQFGGDSSVTTMTRIVGLADLNRELKLVLPPLASSDRLFWITMGSDFHKSFREVTQSRSDLCQAAGRFSQTCRDGSYCNPDAKSTAEACPCATGFYTHPQDSAICSSSLLLDHTYYGEDTFLALTQNSVLSLRTGYDIEAILTLQNHPAITLAVKRVGSELQTTITSIVFPSGVIFVSGRVTFFEKGERVGLMNVLDTVPPLTEALSIDVRIYTKMSQVRDYIYTTLGLPRQPLVPTLGKVLHQPQFDFDCDPIHTITSFYYHPYQLQCDCQDGWIGKFCDVEVTAAQSIGLNVVFFDLTPGSVSAAYYNNAKLSPQIMTNNNYHHSIFPNGEPIRPNTKYQLLIELAMPMVQFSIASTTQTEFSFEGRIIFTFTSAPCDITPSSCYLFGTSACQESSGLVCSCGESFFGPLCNVSHQLAFSSAVLPFTQSFLDLLQSPLTGYYPGQLLTISALPSAVTDADGTDVYEVYDGVDFSTPLATFSTSQPSPTFRLPLEQNKQWYYTNSRIQTQGLGFLPISRPLSGFVKRDECEWFDSNFDLTTITGPTSPRPCNIAGSAKCHLEVADITTICECKSAIYDAMNNEIHHWFGQFCQYQLKVSLGPFYIGQRTKIVLATSNPELYPLYSSDGLNSIELHDVKAVRAPIVITPTSKSGLATAYQSYLITIPDTGVDTQSPLTLPTAAQINALTHFKWVIKTSQTQSFDLGASNKVRVVEPCYYTRLVGHSLMCSEETDSSGNYVAVNSCMNPTTHEIQCNCKVGFHFDECRFGFELMTPPRSTGYYFQQPLQMTAKLYTTPLDIGFLGLPAVSLLVKGQSSSPMTLQRTSLSRTGNQFHIKASPNMAFFSIHILKTSPASLILGFEATMPTLNASGLSVLQEATLSHQYSDLPQASLPVQATLTGAQQFYGVSCPGTAKNAATPFGCRCPGFGVFGPHCGFLFDVAPSYNQTRPQANFIYSQNQVYTYRLSQIKSPIALPAGSKHTSLPKKYHLEMSIVAGSSLSPYNFPSRIQVPAGPTPQSLMTPNIANDNSGMELWLVSDDVEDQAEGREYLLSGMFLRTSTCPPDVSYGLTISAMLGLSNSCLCVQGYFGDRCEYRVQLPEFKIQIDPPRDGGHVVSISIPTIGIEVPTTSGPMILSGARLVAIPNVLSNDDPPQHLMSVNADRSELNYQGELKGFTGKITQFELILGFNFLGSFSLQSEDTRNESQNDSPVIALLSNVGLNDDFGLFSRLVKSELSAKPVLNPFQVQQTADLEFKVPQPISLSIESCSTPVIGNVVTCTPTVLVPSVTNIRLLFGNKPSNHLAAPISTITHPGSRVSVTLPVYKDVSGKAVIIMGVYVQDSTGAYSPDFVVISAITSAISPLSAAPRVFLYTIPPSLVASKLFYTVTFPAPAGSSIRKTVTSPTFATVPNCLAQPTNANDHANLASWKSICPVNSQCSSITQKCTCDPGWKGESCSEKDIPCPQCQQDNLRTCNPDNTCVCKSEWSGDSTCHLPTSCLQSSEKKCSGDNGYLTPSTSPGKCSNTCICNNQWVGSKCQSCAMQCLNGGQPYSKCDRCGCSAGFLPPFCECHAVDGAIVINGFNSVLNQYFKLMAVLTDEVKSSALYQDHTVLSAALTESVNFLLAEFMDLGETTVTTRLEPVNDYTSTRIQVQIKFGCAEFNPEVNLVQLQDRWATMLATLTTDEAFGALFTFPKDVIVVEPTDLVDVSPTLPEGSDQLGSATNLSTLFVLISSLFALILLG